ncbi:MAG: SPFH domain-containing protein [bacterium]|nr:SPFH domain-containing protein [bacterium]
MSLFAIVGIGVVGLVALIFLFAGLALISDNQVGVLTKKMFGKKMPEGQIIARNGEIGIQAWTLMPGLYWRNPIAWKIEKVPVTDIHPNEIGVLESVDGEPLLKGRRLGDEVECDQFQNAKAFLDNGGQKGPQVAVLRPGTYRINTKVFKVTKKPVQTIPKEKIGIVIALDGIPLPSGYIVAPKPIETKDESHPKYRSHKFFQDGQAFLDSEGYRGPQLDTLQAGEYYVNPLLFEVKNEDVADVPPGYVAVLRSNVGKELEKKAEKPGEISKEPTFDQALHESIETLLIPDRNTRGIWREPVAPGKYNLNRIAFTPYLVPTSAVTINWAAGSEVRSEYIGNAPKSKTPLVEKSESDKATEFFKFSQLRVTSKDGFQLDVDVKMIIRIRPENAAFIIARFGSVENLIEQIVHPLIDSSFRNKAGEEKAIEFIRGRTKLQQEALEKARAEFAQYNVEAQNLLIAYIDVDKALLETQTKKEIAIQQIEQYTEEAKARQGEIQVREKEARSAKQKDVIDAKLEIDIKTDKATARAKEAEGESNYIRTVADGNAHREREVGKGVADAYKAQVEALGGPGYVAMVKLIQEVAAGKVRITPDVLVTGGEGGQGGNLFNAFMATLLTQQLPAKAKSDEEKKVN